MKKLKSKRERAAAEVGKLLKTDPVFRENFLRTLPIDPMLELILSLSLDQSIVPIPPSTLPGNEPPKE